MYQQPVLPIADPTTFNAVKTAIDSSFSSARVADFLRTLDRGHLRIREFEEVLRKGALGKTAASEYAALSDVDQGQIREIYLASLERVAPELRQKFFKLYSYY